MATPNFIGELLAELTETRGLKRDAVAKALGVKGETISTVKNGKGSIGDERLHLLAQLHGGYTGEEIKIEKYLDWLRSEKGISADELLGYLVRRDHSRKRNDKDAA